MERLTLHVPTLEELWYRQRIMQDAATMSYNRGYDWDFTGYHRDTGCIDFPEAQWRAWYNDFVEQEPERYYAYIMRLEDGAFLGEVNVHRGDRMQPWYEMGIVLEAKHRKRGYALEALELLLDCAFGRLNAPAVHNAFEAEREAAARLHRKAGFREICNGNGMLDWLITKEEWQRKRGFTPLY